MKREDLPVPPAYTGPVPVSEQEHYDRIRQARDWSWETLADYFETTGGTDPATPRLVEWAKSQAEAKPAKAKRGASAEPEKRG